ncbi:MAG: hypothetical protein ACLRQX_11065 [Turicibacter sanguinis]
MNKGLYDYLVQEENQPLTGWNFDYLERSGRMVEFPLKWHLPTIIKDFLRGSFGVRYGNRWWRIFIIPCSTSS